MVQQSPATFDQLNARVTEPLLFVDDPKAHRATWVAAALVVAMLGWVGSGWDFPDQPSTVTAEADRDVPAQFVVVEASTAESIELFFAAVGDSLPNQEVWIVPGVSGIVTETSATSGDVVTEGDILSRLDDVAQMAALEDATAQLETASRELEVSQALRARGVATEDRVSDARAAVQAAEARLADARNELSETEIIAPFSGRVEAVDLVDGAFVQAGAEIIQLVDMSQIIVHFRVPHHAISRLEIGAEVEVFSPTHAPRTGRLTFLGQRADETTRTFAAEVTVENAEDPLPAGISLHLRIPTGTTTAHFVSPAVLSMDAAGTLGLRTVGSGDIAEFQPVTIVDAQSDGVWVTGLQDQATIITFGQGFVTDGQPVTYQQAQDGASLAEGLAGTDEDPT